jgi:hypothetical protein
MYLVNKFKKNPNVVNQAELLEEIKSIKFFDGVFGSIKDRANLTGKIGVTTNFDCYKKAINELEYSCGEVNTYS